MVCANLLIHMDFDHAVSHHRFLQLLSFRRPRREIEMLLKDRAQNAVTLPAEIRIKGESTERFIHQAHQAPLIILKKEALICITLDSMVRSLELDQGLYHRSLTPMRKKHDIFKELVELYVPKLIVKFEQQGFPDLQFFCCNWFMTLFTEPSAKFDPSSSLGVRHDKLITGVWEQFIIRGWKIIFRLSLLILDELQDALLVMDDIEPMIRLLNNPFKSIQMCGRSRRKDISSSWLLRQSKVRFKVTESILLSVQMKIDHDEYMLDHPEAEKVPQPKFQISRRRVRISGKRRTTNTNNNTSLTREKK